MKSPLSEESMPALRAIGQLVQCDDNEIIDLCLFHGTLEAFDNLLYADNKNNQQIKEIMWCLSNITAGSEQHIHAFLSYKDLVTKVFQLMQNDFCYDLRRESMLVITNLLTTINDTQYHMHVFTLNDNQIINDMV